MEWVGYFAAALVFCTFYMRTMLPLRWMAIASNIAFLCYAIPPRLFPIIILHGLLLPLNLFRLRQLYRMLAALRTARSRSIDIAGVLPYLVRHDYPPGTVLFKKGDPGDSGYYIASGEVELPEVGKRLGSGHFFGEIGVFATGGTRTLSAICATAATLYRIEERDLVTAFHQSPALAFALVRLIADRLSIDP